MAINIATVQSDCHPESVRSYHIVQRVVNRVDKCNLADVMQSSVRTSARGSGGDDCKDMKSLAGENANPVENVLHEVSVKLKLNASCQLQ